MFPTLLYKDAKRVTSEVTLSPSTSSLPLFMKYPHHLEYENTIQATIYCSLDFKSFPFDSHACEFAFGDQDYNTCCLQFTTPSLIYGLKHSHLGKESLQIDQDRIPFKISIQSLEPFTLFIGGFNNSYARMRIDLKRTGLGLLLGGFYIPTGVFAFLSLISFSINTGMVINQQK